MDDRNCTATASFQLDSITNSLSPDSVLLTINDVSCFGLFNGSITINSVVGGIQPYNYTWFGPGSPGTGAIINSLYAGIYSVSIQDSNACVIAVTAEVEEPDLLEYTTLGVTDESIYGACDGQISVDVQGGTGNYYYDKIGDLIKIGNRLTIQQCKNTQYAREQNLAYILGFNKSSYFKSMAKKP